MSELTNVIKHPVEAADKIVLLKRENERLQDIVDDYREWFAKVLDDKCPTDERHCGCVPILRKQLSNYQNALVVITAFPSSKQQTFSENKMQEVANNALDYRAGQKIDACEYWVEKVSDLESELQLAVDMRNKMVSIYTEQILSLEEKLRKAGIE